jgi:hypothetical protein
MSNETELRVNRVNTVRFIAARPTEVTLTPVEKVKTSSGGFRWEDRPDRDPQTFRIIDLNVPSGNSPGLLTAIDGKQLKVISQLLGPYDSVMAVGDHWTDENGKRCEIGELLPYNGYERRAQVIRYG